MKFKQLNNLNLGIISCITAILTVIFDLSYSFIVHYENPAEAILDYTLLLLILLSINLFGILLGIIGLLKNKPNKKTTSPKIKRNYPKLGIILNLSIIVYKLFLRNALAIFWWTLFR